MKINNEFLKKTEGVQLARIDWEDATATSGKVYLRTVINLVEQAHLAPMSSFGFLINKNDGVTTLANECLFEYKDGNNRFRYTTTIPIDFIKKINRLTIQTPVEPNEYLKTFSRATRDNVSTSMEKNIAIIKWRSVSYMYDSISRTKQSILEKLSVNQTLTLGLIVDITENKLTLCTGMNIDTLSTTNTIVLPYKAVEVIVPLHREVEKK